MRINRKYVFDVDGTLTPSRQKIDEEFATYFEDFCVDNEVYLVTGSDRSKTQEQLNDSILNVVQLSFNCAGNEVWKQDKLIRVNNWKPSDKLISFLENELAKSHFNRKTGRHIEQRNGMVNFSIVGRNCDLLDRKIYVDWDYKHKERELVAKRIRDRFDDVDVFIGGETGLDIFEKNMGKQQCLEYIRTSDKDVIRYFGDQIFPGGNDYDIAIKCNAYTQVKDWKETFSYIKALSEVR